MIFFYMYRVVKHNVYESQVIKLICYWIWEYDHNMSKRIRTAWEANIVRAYTAMLMSNIHCKDMAFYRFNWNKKPRWMRGKYSVFIFLNTPLFFENKLHFFNFICIFCILTKSASKQLTHKSNYKKCGQLQF